MPSLSPSCQEVPPERSIIDLKRSETTFDSRTFPTSCHRPYIVLDFITVTNYNTIRLCCVVLFYVTWKTQFGGTGEEGLWVPTTRT